MRTLHRVASPRLRVGALAMFASAIAACAGFDAAGTRPTQGEPSAAAAGAQPDDPERMLDEVRALYPQAQDEYSFSQFLEGVMGRMPPSKWGMPRAQLDASELDALWPDYYATANTVEPALAVHLRPGRDPRAHLEALRAALKYAKESLPELRRQRMRLSRLILEHVFADTNGRVFGNNDAMNAWFLAEVEQGHAMPPEDFKEPAK